MFMLFYEVREEGRADEGWPDGTEECLYCRNPNTDLKLVLLITLLEFVRLILLKCINILQKSMTVQRSAFHSDHESLTNK